MKDIKYDSLSEALMLRVRSGLMTSPEDITLLIRSVNTQSLAMLKDTGGGNIGYVAWGSVNKYSVLNLINNGILPRYFYEFSEGNICLLLGVFIFPGRTHEGIRSLKAFIKTNRALTYIKKGKAVCLTRRKNRFYKGISKRFPVAPSPVQKTAA